MVAAVGPNRPANAPAGRYWWNSRELGLLTALMNCTRAALSRGFRTTVPDSGADEDTAPSDLAPAGTRGAAPTRTIRGELAAAAPDPIATGSATSRATRAARLNPLAMTASKVACEHSPRQPGRLKRQRAYITAGSGSSTEIALEPVEDAGVSQ